MNKLEVNLENCYGINKLEYSFDFSNCKTFVIYAPNGAMKTSFANTFRDVAGKIAPRDKMDSSLVPTCNILIDNTKNIIPLEEICVIEPYNEKAFDSEDKVLTLLANEDIKKEYLTIYKELDSSKELLLKKIKKISQSTNCEAEIINTFSSGKRSIFEIFTNIIDDVKKSKEIFSFRYNHVFDPEGKVKDFLSENKELFTEYCDKYKDLISTSDFFGQNSDCVFGTTEAKNIKKSIDGNEFFSIGHKLNIKKYGEVNSKDDFGKILDEEINKIFSNKDLKKVFETIDTKLNTNQKLKDFKKVIEQDPTLIIRLNDYESFRKEVWYGLVI